MNKKAQAGPIGGIFLYIFFIIMWFVWLGAWVNNVGDIVVTANNLTGILAFFLNNLNLVIFIAITLGMMSFIYLTGGTG